MLRKTTPGVTISIKQFGSELFLRSSWHNCYPYKPDLSLPLCHYAAFFGCSFQCHPFPLSHRGLLFFLGFPAPLRNVGSAEPGQAACTPNPALASNQRRTKRPEFGRSKNASVAFTRTLRDTQCFPARYRFSPSAAPTFPASPPAASIPHPHKPPLPHFTAPFLVLLRPS